MVNDCTLARETKAVFKRYLDGVSNIDPGIELDVIVLNNINSPLTNILQPPDNPCKMAVLYAYIGELLMLVLYGSLKVFYSHETNTMCNHQLGRSAPCITTFNPLLTSRRQHKAHTNT